MKKYLIIFFAFLVSCGGNDQTNKTQKTKTFTASLATVSTVQTYVVCHDTVDLPNDSLQLIGSACSSDSTKVTKTGWKQVSGPVSLVIGLGDSPYVKNFAPGTFILQYTATNNQGVFASANDTLIINPPPIVPPPIAIPTKVVTTVYDQNGNVISSSTINLFTAPKKVVTRSYNQNGYTIYSSTINL